MILTLIGAFGWAIGNVSARMARPRQPLQLTLWMSIVPVVPLAILSALFEGPRIGPALATAFTPGALSANLGLLYIVIFASVVGYGIWNTMMARYPASVVAPFSMLVPIVGILSSWAMLGETPRLLELAAGGLVLGGVILASRAPRMPAPAA